MPPSSFCPSLPIPPTIRRYVVTSNDYTQRPINATFIDGKVKHVFQSGPFHIYKVKYD